MTATDAPADARPNEQHHGMGSKPYKLLALAVGLHFVVMFALTYAGVNTWDEIFLNLNRFYMAVLMVASMVIVMVLVMWRMFEHRRTNIAIVATAAVVFVASFGMLRAETFVGNRQFLRSMIPHHSIAIHTCENANISDPEIKDLCSAIIDSQRREIAQMRKILDRLDN
jgi:hypothetical protein